MSTPTDTMEWLVSEFRSRAVADPEEHTKQDAEQVELARNCFRNMLEVLHEIAALPTLMVEAEKAGVAEKISLVIDRVGTASTIRPTGDQTVARGETDGYIALLDHNPAKGWHYLRPETITAISNTFDDGYNWTGCDVFTMDGSTRRVNASWEQIMGAVEEMRGLAQSPRRS